VALVWILFGTLVLAGAFFVVCFAQALGVEARLRRLVVETEGRISHSYSLRLVPPGHAGEPAAAKKAPAAAEAEAESEADENDEG
jgi:hypothetical protein